MKENVGVLVNFKLKIVNEGAEYEKFTQEIYNEILKKQSVKNIEVMHNVKLIGKSGQKHQIDVYWEYQYDNTIFKIAIECKNYNHTVSICKVRDFFGVLYDLEEVKGIMVTKKGYQEGAKKYGEFYGIDLMELREPEDGEAIVAETTLTIDCSVRHRLFLIDEDWAKEHDLNIQSYKQRLDWLCSPVCGKWINAIHIPLTTKEDKIRNSEGKIIVDIRKLEDELPKKSKHDDGYVYPFENAYVKTECGDIKIKEVKFEYESHTDIKQFEIDAQNITKAILKNAINKEVLFVEKKLRIYLIIGKKKRLNASNKETLSLHSVL